MRETIERCAPPVAEPDPADATLPFQARRGPQFCIVSPELDVVFASSAAEEVPLGPLAPALANIVAAARRELEGAGETTSSWIPYDTCHLRVVRIAGPAIDALAVFFERPRGAKSLAHAVRHFKFSKREADVLELLMRGFATIEIARELSIAPSTARDHIVSMMRKTSSHRRGELLATTLIAAEAGSSAALAPAVAPLS